MPNHKLLCLELIDQLKRSALAHRNENQSRLTFNDHIEFIEEILASFTSENAAVDYEDLCKSLTEKLQSSLDTHWAYGNKKAGIECQQVLNRVRIALIPDEQLLDTYARALTAVIGDAQKPWPTELINQSQLAGLRAVLERLRELENDK